jgi:hypothetical protein
LLFFFLFFFYFTPDDFDCGILEHATSCKYVYVRER